MLSIPLLINAFLLCSSFILVLIFGIFLPGYLLKRVVAPQTNFTALGLGLLSFALGIGLINASLLFLGNLSLPLNASNVATWYLIFFGVMFVILRYKKTPLKETPLPLLTTRKELIVTALFIFFLFFIKVFYLSGTILPTSTDLGHHLYWAKLTTDTQALPIYQKQEIIQNEAGAYSLSEPTPIADFIIGEHLPLSFIHMFTGASYFGTFPLLFLFFLNICSVFALALLLYTIGKGVSQGEGWQHIRPSTFFIVGIFVFGGLFALASPEMKFVSGGVIGNLFGNFFIPFILLLFIRTLSEKSAPLLALTLLLTATLAYTHHLSTFILLFVILFGALAMLLLWQKHFFFKAKEWLPLAGEPVVLMTLFGVFLFALFVALPTYLDAQAINTAVGTPTKDTRTGLTLAQLTMSNSAFKLGIALFGLFLITVTASLRKNIGVAILFGYGVVLLIMTLAPQLLLVDIPSTRIAHYLSFPLGLLAAFTTLYFLEKVSQMKMPLLPLYKTPLFVGAGLLIWLSLIAPGLEDNGKTLTLTNQGLYVQETFAAARYLQEHVLPGELIVKDHNFIEASDTWMKLFFSQDYNYPLSRSFFGRYEDNPGREQCTLAMIATPNTPLGKQCYQDLPVRYIVVNPKFDQAQFLKSPQFSLVYSSLNIAVFHFDAANQETSN